MRASLHADDFGVSIELSLELLLMLLVLVSHDVQNGISYDFDFVRYGLSILNFLPTPLHSKAFFV